MTNRAVAIRYAKVLFNLDYNEDRTKDNFEKRLEDFKVILPIFKENPKLLQFMKSPQISLADKTKVLNEVLKSKTDHTFLNYLSYLVEKRSLDHLSIIEREYRRLVDDLLEIWEVDVITAVPLDAGSEARLKEKIENEFQRKVILNKEVDPSIIGGTILIMENKMLDWSIAGRLKKMKENLILTEV